ncbi:hypothetical protein BKA61DRAFT_581101 [Leptodontidium sp. MPI-SDFR-AT-0119]|nr:hypothetical protein BKA61DRAFT_581101 [Leptodontidium sp. MPI-SDFR-AT-0119]
MALRILGSNPSILDGLHYGSELLLSMHNEFIRFYGTRVSVVNFYEERKTRILKFGFLQWEEYVVRKDSAMYESPKTVNIGLHVDHKGLNKFPARSSDYKRIVEELNRLIKADREIHLASRVEVVPKIKVSAYVERPALSYAVKEKLELLNYEGSSLSTPHCLVLHGLGGCGKTQLALSYIETQAERFNSIFWISASSLNAVVRSYRAIADEIGLELDQPDPFSFKVSSNPMLAVRSVMRWLEGLKGTQAQWLVVIDELESLEVDPSEFIPRGEQGTLLVTSRRHSTNSIYAKYLPRGCQTLQVDVLEKTEAVELLLSAITHSISTALTTDIELANQIAQLVDYHPLALGLAHASVVQAAITEGYDRALGIYLQDLKNHQDELLGDPGFSELTRYEKTIQTTWDTSLAAIDAQNSNSTKLLSLLSHFHKDNILFNFFRYASDRFNAESRPFNSMFQELPDWIRDLLRHTGDGVWDSFAFRRALDPLLSYSMVQPISSSVGYGVRLHGLVQWRAQQIDSKNNTLVPALYIATAAAREVQIIRHIPLRKQLVSHLQYLNRTIQQEDDTRSSNFSRYEGMVYDIIGHIYHQEGLLEEAKHALWSAFAVSMTFERPMSNSPSSETTFGPDFLAVTINMANIHESQDNWNQSERLLEIAMLAGDLWAREGLRNDTLQIWYDLGRTYRLQGRYAEAEEKFSAVREEYSKIFGQESEENLGVLEELAGLYKEQGRWQDTERLYKEIAAILVKADPDQKGSAITHLANKVEYFVRRGRLAEAEDLGTQILVKSRDLLGDEHDTTLILTGTLAGVYSQTGRCDDAIAMGETVLSVRSRRYGVEAPHTLLTTINLGAMYGRCDRSSEAFHILNRTMHITQNALSPEHPLAIRAKGHLVHVLMYQKNWNQSAELQVQVVDSSIRALGKEHPETLKRMAVLGKIYTRLNQHDEAQRVVGEALDTSRIALQSDDPLFQVLIQTAAQVNLKQNDIGSALLQLVELLIIRRNEYGIAHKRTLETCLELGLAFMDFGMLDVAETSFQIVEQYGLDIFEEGHELPMMAIERLGRLYLQQRQWKLSYWRFQYLLRVFTKLRGEEHPYTIQSMSDTGWTLLKMGYLLEAEELLQRVLRARKSVPEEIEATALVMLDLGLLYIQQNRGLEAEDVLMEVIYTAVVSRNSAVRSLASSALYYLSKMGETRTLNVDMSLLDKYADEFKKRAES